MLKAVCVEVRRTSELQFTAIGYFAVIGRMGEKLSVVGRTALCPYFGAVGLGAFFIVGK
jgi:hypothetical protein